MTRTNPCGRMFFSYSRTSKDLANPMMDCLRDVGVPLWQDTRNLENEPCSPELEKVLNAPDTAGAILFLTEPVAKSPTIRNVEAPAILERASRARRDGDPFLVVPIAAGGLDRSKAAAVLGNQKDLGAITTHNAETNGDGSPAALRAVAERILAGRLRRIHQQAPPGPIRASIHTRTAPPFQPSEAMTVDISHRFNDRFAKDGAWQAYVLPALDVIQRAVAGNAPGRHVQWNGQCVLPAALALGAAFRLPRGTAASWVQSTNGTTEDWSNQAQPSQCRFTAYVEKPNPDSREAVVTVSVNSDVRNHVAALAGLPKPFRTNIDFLPDATDARNLDAGRARHLAGQVQDLVRKAMEDAPGIDRIHVFLAGPVGLAFLIGQRLNTLPHVHTYEHDSSGQPHAKYRPAAILDPSHAH